MEQHDEPKVGAHQDQLEGGVVEAEERQEWLLKKRRQHTMVLVGSLETKPFC